MPGLTFPLIVFLLVLFAFVMTTIVIAFAIAMLPPVLLVSFSYPVLTYKVHGAPTRIVFATVLSPVFLVTWWNVQIERLSDR